MSTRPQIEVEAVFRREGEKMYRAIFGYTGNADLARDVVADAFAQALARGAEIHSPSAWIWKASFRIAAGELKKSPRRLPVATERAEEMTTLPYDILLALKQLSNNQRASVLLHDYVGYTTKEIARILGVAAPTCESTSVRQGDAFDGCWRSTNEDIGDRLHDLDKFPVRVTWQDVESRQPRTITTGTGRRLAAAAVGLAVFVAGVFVAWSALRPQDRPGAGYGSTKAVLTISKGGADGGFPSATLTFEGERQPTQVASYTWDGAFRDTVIPRLREFIQIPDGADIDVAGSAASIEMELGDSARFAFPTISELQVVDGRAILDAVPDRYALVVQVEWPEGTVPFYFGIEVVPRSRTS